MTPILPAATFGSRVFAIALAFIAISSVCNLCNVCYAQRAEHFGREDPPARNATSDFPGLFDTNLAAKGTVVGYLPWLSAYWGVTDRLTLGTNLLYALPLVTGSPGGLISARYRFYSSPSLQTVLDGIVGGFEIRNKDSNERSSHSLVLTAVHTAIALAPEHELTVSVMAGNVALATETSTELTDVALTGLGIGAGYAYFPTHWFAVRAFVLTTPLVAGVAETNTLRLEANLSASSGFFQRLLYRAMASFRLGNHWLLEIGVLGVGVQPLPWLNVGFRIG
ncbi:MAG: hypothetical protein RL701_463 [Pseudomonadota bacterium]|jgi:hypothetical protein